MDEDDGVASLEKIPAFARAVRSHITASRKATGEKGGASWCVLGGRGPSLAGAEIVDVAHAPLLQGHRGAAGGDADHPRVPSSGPCSAKSSESGPSSRRALDIEPKFCRRLRDALDGLGALVDVKKDWGLVDNTCR
jgi:hypothetical protein